MLKYRWGVHLCHILKVYEPVLSTVPSSPTSTFGSRILIHNSIKHVRTHPVVQHGPHPKYSSLVHPVFAMIPPPGYSLLPEVIPRRSLCQGPHRQSTTSEGQGQPLSLGVSQGRWSLQANKPQQGPWTLIPLQASPACPALKESSLIAYNHPCGQTHTTSAAMSDTHS